MEVRHRGGGVKGRKSGLDAERVKYMNGVKLWVVVMVKRSKLQSVHIGGFPGLPAGAYVDGFALAEQRRVREALQRKRLRKAAAKKKKVVGKPIAGKKRVNSKSTRPLTGPSWWGEKR